MRRKKNEKLAEAVVNELKKGGVEAKIIESHETTKAIVGNRLKRLHIRTQEN
ncbi:hypothetical protein [Paenibacillus antri]|uniref:hypothetical protein n=1 Tax=Paenibacillus antri TaxID=2582848 RepID=UPI0013052F78|nr:hypothetical protein [Paenibacillus antri]